MHRVEAVLRQLVGLSPSLRPVAAATAASATKEIKIPSDPAYPDQCSKAIVPEVMKLKEQNVSVADIFAATMTKCGADAPFLVDGATGRSLSFGDVDRLSNRVARLGLQLGLRCRADSAALLMNNAPEYIALWLGMTKIGVPVYFVNPAQHGASLLHSLRLSRASVLLFGADLLPAVRELARDIVDDMRMRPFALFSERHPERGELPPAFGSLGRALQPLSDAALPADTPRPGASDPLFMIFTSGTTGLPKAAIIDHARMFRVGLLYQRYVLAQPSDRIYCSLPLCHASASMIGTGIALFSGAALVISEKFSASRFWSEVRSNRCTMIMYIGELCRYLLQGAPATEDARRVDYRPHAVRAAIGNGLARDIWPEFTARFAIPTVAEFYGATEGPASFMGLSGRVGAVGFIPQAERFAGIKRFARMDAAHTQLLRDPKTGFCTDAAFDEPGEFIVDVSLPGSFLGYTSKEESNKKLARDVFRKGDAWFRSGDLMRMDRDGHVYFVDRIGDTFRYKGENVSTTEVAHALMTFTLVDDAAPAGVSTAFTEANVYGVKVPHADGRIGMAAVVPSALALVAGTSSAAAESKQQQGPPPPPLQLDAERVLRPLAAHLSRALPGYARPAFLRVQRAVATTHTLKQLKHALQAQGFDLALAAAAGDALYVLLTAENRYAPLTPQLVADIESGALRW